MKERPILFKGEMVRAILSGQKTQTRRVAKANPTEYEDIGLFDAENPCPYGQVGDLLWVRETFLPKTSGLIYRADFDDLESAGLGGLYGGWKPSIFMPRSESRITLKIIGVRVERLNDISHADAISEGVSGEAALRDKPMTVPQLCYANLWESINGAGSWDANPLVWVVEFKRVEAGQ